MKKLKMILTSLLTVCMLFGSSVVSVFAAEEEYTYTATFFAGNQGTFSGIDGLSVESTGTPVIDKQSDKVVVSGLKLGDKVSFVVQNGAVALGDSSKYYVKGVRISGRDNNSLETSAFHVNGDRDFVVAYGIQGDMVGYTVNYQDEEGNQLAPSRTYYGNVGDKPVVAYLYVENYTPQALALTKTLSSNESQNVFTFVYTPVTTETVTVPGETTTVTTVVPGTTTTETTVVETPAAGTPAAGTTGAAGTEGAAGTAGAAGEAGTAGAEGTAGTAGAGTEEGTQVIEPEEVPQGNQDVVDLDEDETPLADNPEETKEKVKKGLPLAAGIAIGVGAVAALSGLAVFLIRRRR